MKPEDKAREFALSLIETPQFRQLKTARQGMNSNTALNRSIEQLLQERAASAQSGDSAAVAAADAKLRKLSHTPEMDSFLKASKQFSDLMMHTYSVINQIIDSKLE